MSKFAVSIILLLGLNSISLADDIVLLGTMGNKGLFQINGQKKTLQAGQESGAFKIVTVNAESAMISSNGKQRQLQLGQGYVSQESGQATGGGSLTLTPDERGHYMVDVGINQTAQKGIVDTGATHLSISRNTADSMNIKYKDGQIGYSQTANGRIGAWLIKLPQVKVGNVMLYDVQTVIRDSVDNGPILVGMSVLNRFQMKREQELMILSKKVY
ncbi:TIGR02281 family clan AA aspartic protease [Chitinibacter sp. S2-10]|uniref:retropepsin-like aspartic protease family protein n=1 Tax=Chitinibacter sp. S2-10 TaxID=3373597 RepID=UPI0039773651